MMNVRDYIELILTKKKWTRTKLCEEINKIEIKIGDSRTTVPNISAYMKEEWAFRPKILAKWEAALDLKEGTLMNMVAEPICKESKKELKETIEKIRIARKEVRK